MTADLVAFLTARLDEDEQIARAAAPGPWTESGRDSIGEGVVYSHATGWAVVGSVATGYGPNASYANVSLNAAHIARHDPARVLAEVDAKRRILNELLDEIDDRDRTHWTEYWSRAMGPYKWLNTQLLQIMAVPYADHPDYRPEWAPGA